MFTLNDIFPPKSERSQGQIEKYDLLEKALSKHLDEMISILFRDMNKITDRKEHLHYALPSLEMIRHVLPILRKNQEAMKETTGLYNFKDHMNFKESIKNFNTFYTEVSGKLAAEKRISTQKLDTFKKASMILCEIQQYSDTK
jgi:hypothetical protein